MNNSYRALSQEEFTDIATRILYEDNHLIAINKKAGEIVQGDKTGDEPLSETMKGFIAQRDEKPGRVFMGVPHRLDRPVTGVALFAKTSKALERLNALFRENSGVGVDAELDLAQRKVVKQYWALLANAPNPSEGELRHFLLRNEKQNKSYPYDHSVPGSKEAVLKYKLLRATQKYFLVEIELLTGRHHQIRCQMAAIGSPIKGDLKYGARRSNPDGGISLHARSITLEHPVRKERITIVAPSIFEEM